MFFFKKILKTKKIKNLDLQTGWTGQVIGFFSVFSRFDPNSLVKRFSAPTGPDTSPVRDLTGQSGPILTTLVSFAYNLEHLKVLFFL
jgi:hypothetical protein